MKIGIDITPAETNPAGIGQYVLNLLDALLKIDSTNQYYIYSTKAFVTEQTNVVIARRKVLPFKGVLWILDVAKHAKKNGIEIFISPSNFLFSILHPKTIQFIHDLGPIFYPQFFSRKGALFYKLMTKFLLPKAWKVATISETVKSELLKFTKIPAQKIAVIYPSINSKIFSNAVDFVDFNLPEQYLISVSTLEPRKDILAVLTGFKEYLTNYADAKTKLVLVGKKGWFYSAIFKKITELELEEKVIFMGYVEDRFIFSILKKAKAAIYLNRYEGFGMPVLESLYCGLPTIVNDIQVFRECFADSAIFVDAKESKQVAEAINSVVTQNIKPNFDQDKFTWDKSAQTLLNLFDS